MNYNIKVGMVEDSFSLKNYKNAYQNDVNLL